jgi:hypothetical protein
MYSVNIAAAQNNQEKLNKISFSVKPDRLKIPLMKLRERGMGKVLTKNPKYGYWYMELNHRYLLKCLVFFPLCHYTD